MINEKDLKKELDSRIMRLRESEVRVPSVVTFKVNAYVAPEAPRYGQGDWDNESDQGQAPSMRDILTKFAVTGMTREDLQNRVRAKYAAEFSDDIDLKDPRVDSLLDSPDLSHMDEMEINDYLNEHTEEVSVKDLRKQFAEQKSVNKSSSSKEEKPGDPGLNQEEH